MYKDLLPTGSVVRLKEGDHYLMIIGRVAAGGEPLDVYDYVACAFPEGMTDFENAFFFNRDRIDEVIFVGYQDERELNFRKEILDNLKALAVKDGELVPADEV